MSKIKVDTKIHMGRRTYGEGYQYNWQWQDLQSFKIPHNKTFLIFGGNSTNCAEAANGNAKVIENLLTEDNRKKVSLYSFLYDSEPFNIRTKKLYDEYVEECHKIYETIIKPVLLDRIGRIKEKQGIEKSLKNLVFVSHCGGSNFVDIIIEEMYQTLLEKFHPSEVDHLISRVQYYSYAPNTLSNKSVNACVVTPFYDIGYSWEKVVYEVMEKRIDSEYPGSVIKKIKKFKGIEEIPDFFERVYKKHRIITLRTEQNIYLIPNRINSNIEVGDHSIDCLIKNNVLNADTEYSKTAKIVNKISSMILNHFASENSFDCRVLFNEIRDHLNVESKVENDLLGI